MRKNGICNATRSGHGSSPSSSSDQKSYWSGNLDPDNLGAQFDPATFRYERELAFYLTPDQCFALEKFAPIEGKTILDVGAGIGMNSLYLARQGAQVIAIDLSHERLCTLRQIYAANAEQSQPGRIFPVRCRVEALPFREDVFDHQYSKSVLIHTELPESVAELRRTLRAGSSAVFIEPLTRNPFVVLYRRTFAPRIWQEIAHYFTTDDLQRFEKAFARTEIRFFYLGAFFAFIWQYAFRLPWMFRVKIASGHFVDALLFRTFPALRRFAWFAAIHVQK